MDATTLKPGTLVQAFNRNDPGDEFGVGTVLVPEGPLSVTPMVLVAMQAFDGFGAMSWWFDPDQVRVVAATESSGGAADG